MVVRTVSFYTFWPTNSDSNMRALPDFKKWLRHLVNPLMADALPIGMITSPLDARGERNGLALIEDLVKDPATATVLKAFDEFLGPPYGTLALKKALHILIENRIHALAIAAAPPEQHGYGRIEPIAFAQPLDSVAARAISISAPPIGGTWRLTLAIHLQCLYFMGKALITGSIAARSRVDAMNVSVASPAFIGPRYWAPVLRAASDVHQSEQIPFALVAEPGCAVDPGPEIPFLNAKNLCVERKRWWREIIFPGFRLVQAAIYASLRLPREGHVIAATAAWSMMHLANRNLDFARLLHVVKIASYLDIAEYEATQAVRAAFLKRSGGRLVRWPYCVLDSPGAPLSYLCYDVFLGTGPYEANTYGSSWAPQTRAIPVGFFKNDRYWNEGSDQVNEKYTEMIGEKLASGSRMLTYFGPSVVPGIEPLIDVALTSLVNATVAHSEYFLVIKAKGLKAFGQVVAALDRIDATAQLKKEDRLIVIGYEEHGVEPCPAGWLINKMSAGVGIGSVQLEALTQGKPLFSFVPVVQDTPYQQKLAACGLGHLTKDSLDASLNRWLAAPEDFEIPYDWFGENFDPFRDDQALKRIAALLWGDAAHSVTDTNSDQEQKCPTSKIARTA